jgi:hypothetical protein
VTLDGQKTTLIVCPQCGMAGHCAEHDSSVNDDGKLTVWPAVLCSCGGHYWLTDGVLREI